MQQKILILDDNRHNIEILREALEKLYYEVT
jgi:CheY-like chemotaxis protein